MDGLDDAVAIYEEVGGEARYKVAVYHRAVRQLRQALRRGETCRERLADRRRHRLDDVVARVESTG